MRKQLGPTLLLTALLLCWASLVGAETPVLEGTATLKGGQTLTGEIKVAQFGVVMGSQVGTIVPDLGFFRLRSADQIVEVKAADIALVETTWALASEGDPQSWEIEQISVLRRDGSRVAGTPTWTVQASGIYVGDTPALYAFPKGGLDFNPDNLLVKLEIAGAVAAIPPTPAPTPAEPAPAEPTPTPTPTEPIVDTPPPATEPPPTAPPPTVVTAPAVQPAGEGAMELVITCPKCGEKMVIRVQVQAQPAGQ